MRILFIDPATKPEDRGYSLFRDGQYWMATVDPIGFGDIDPAWQADWAVVEDQWVNPAVSRQSLMTLSQIAGFLLGRVRADRYFAYPVREWKQQLIPGFARAPKDKYTANLAQMWPDTAKLGGNVLDARGMGTAWTKAGYTERQLKKWEIK